MDEDNMDALSERHSHLGDFLELEIDASDIVLADYGGPHSVRSRLGADMPVLAHAPSHVVEVSSGSQLAQLRAAWDGLSPSAQVAAGLIGGALVLTGVAWAVASFGAKAVLGHAAVAAVPIAYGL
jgi:hypothetical protein